MGTSGGGIWRTWRKAHGGFELYPKALERPDKPSPVTFESTCTSESLGELLKTTDVWKQPRSSVFIISSMGFHSC
jgi:hypothetical protein